VIILGRRGDVANDAASKLNEEYPSTTVTARICDVFDRAQSQQLWDELEKERTLIDVLILNAVGEPALQPVLEQGADRLWLDFEHNVHAPLYLVERFYKQPNHDKQKVKYPQQIKGRKNSTYLTFHFSLLRLCLLKISIAGTVRPRCRAIN
jgi:NADP-dependent 3-hydroxy acid dehydrogenase YdfG